MKAYKKFFSNLFLIICIVKSDLETKFKNQAKNKYLC
jgi:hypothetical protein